MGGEGGGGKAIRRGGGQLGDVNKLITRTWCPQPGPGGLDPLLSVQNADRQTDSGTAASFI